MKNQWNFIPDLMKSSCNYLKERNCLRDKFSHFSQILAKFAKLNLREKSTGSQFAKSNPLMFLYGLQWTKNNLQQKIHCVFVDVSERVVLLSRYIIDVKEDITL